MAFSRTLALIVAFAVLSGCVDSNQTAQQSISDTDQQHPLNRFEVRNDDPLAAAASRYQQRLSADGKIPDRALLRAKRQLDEQTEFQSRNGFAGEAQFDWEWVGPGNIGGRLRPIVIHPLVHSVMYVGSASGGIWKTFDAGENWVPLDDFLPSLSISDMKMHPDDPETLYAATGEGFFDTVEGTSNTAAVRGAGIFLSLNSGKTWNQIPSTDNSDFYFVNRLEFDPSNSSTLLAATNTGIWRSVDEGSTWNQQAVFHALDVKFHPENAQLVVAGAHHHHENAYYSTDGGLTWQMSTGAGGHRQEIAWAPGTASTVYAAVSEESRIKIWRSDDGGQTYKLKTTGNGLQTWSGYNTTIWVHPNDPDFLIVGGVWLHRSIDGGETFNQVFGGVHPDMHRIVEHPEFNGNDNNIVFFATDGGIYRTPDVRGNTTVGLNNNLGVTQFYGGAINPTTGNIIGGTQDNGTLFYDGDPQNWRAVFGGDGGYGAADPEDPNYFYGEVQRAYIHRNTTGGVGNNSYIWGGIDDAGSSQTNFIPFFMLDPNDSNRMLVACKRMWRSDNVKEPSPTWNVVKESLDGTESPDLGDEDDSNAHFAENDPLNLATIAVANGNSDVIWAGHNNGHLFFSNNGTDDMPSWIRVDERGGGLPDRWISTIVIDPRNHDHVYVAFMGWEEDNLWETTDNGHTWSNISGTGVLSIPSAPVSAFAMHQNVPGLLYVGTDIGMFSSKDNGITWVASSTGAGSVPIEQLIWRNNRTLLVVTHGRGMYLATEVTTQTSRLRVLTGDATSGSELSIAQSDDNYLGLSPKRTIDRTAQAIELELKSRSEYESPVSFEFRLQAILLGGQTGEVSQEIQLLNFRTREYESIDNRDATTGDEALVITPTGDLSRFVEPLTQRIQTLVTWKRNPLVRRPFTWSVEVDEAVWILAE